MTNSITALSVKMNSEFLTPLCSWIIQNCLCPPLQLELFHTIVQLSNSRYPAIFRRFEHITPVIFQFKIMPRKKGIEIFKAVCNYIILVENTVFDNSVIWAVQLIIGLFSKHLHVIKYTPLLWHITPCWERSVKFADLFCSHWNSGCQGQ